MTYETDIINPYVDPRKTRMLTCYRGIGINDIKPIVSYAEYAFTIVALHNLMVASGSIVISILKNGVAITGMASILVTSTPQTINATGGNAILIGDRVTIQSASNSSAKMLEFAIKITV